MQSFGEVVKLNAKVRHTIHRVSVDWVWCFFPDLGTDTFLIYECYLIIPVTLDGVHYLLNLAFKLVNFANKFESLFTEPTSSFKSNFTPLVGSLLVY